MSRISIFLLLVLVSSVVYGETQSQGKSEKCETLKTSLKYSQENAPQDISTALPLIVERVNRELSGVVDVEVLFTGSEIHRRVGQHTIHCSVTRLLSAVQEGGRGEYKQGIDEHGRDVVTQCFLVPFTITDVNECQMPLGHQMRHKCSEPSVCVNTEGAYECVCPSEDTTLPAMVTSESFWDTLEGQTRSPWNLSLGSSLQSSCPSKVSTHGCCDADAHKPEGASCRAKFKCAMNPCDSPDTNTCVSVATCQRAADPLDQPTYTCKCPEGLMGNGHKCREGIDPLPKPMVKFDGITPTDETKKNDLYCSCTKPIVDPCAGFPKCEGKNEVCTISTSNKPICACKPGFVKVDKFGCVDESPPLMKLRHDPNGDQTTRLKQGDTYKEYAVDIVDENAEDYARSLKIAYSRPLPPGCLDTVGSFHVNYTVATPWTNPPYARITRKVIIEDIDECTLDVDKYRTACPQLIPQCDFDSGATCKNLIGTYTCVCPKFTSGDGFKFIPTAEMVNGKYVSGPEGYNGGTGCRDTSKPVINLVGPNPKVFKTSAFAGLTGIMKQTKKTDGAKAEKLLGAQRSGYEEDIVRMIKATDGAELCATHSKRNPPPSSCAIATDHTYLGNQDLSSKVTVGNPVKVSEFEWKVPYNVIDEAGNAADTVWRRVIVQEVNLDDLEEKIRKDILSDKQKAIDDAVRAAIEKERQRAVPVSSRGQQACPKCPSCECAQSKITDSLSFKECEKHCKNMQFDTQGTCDSEEGRVYHGHQTFVHSLLDGFINLTSGVLSPTFAGIVLIGSFIALGVFMFQRTITANSQGWQYFNQEDERREREMQNQVTYFKGGYMQSPPFVSSPANFHSPLVGVTPGDSAPYRSSATSHGFSPPPPRNSLSSNRVAQSNDIFSPSSRRTQRFGDGNEGMSPTFSATGDVRVHRNGY